MLRIGTKTAALGLVATIGLGWHGAYAAKTDVMLVSRAQSGEKANGASYEPDVSVGGRYVAFTTDASNLHPDDSDTTLDVFVRDMQTGGIALVSRASEPGGAKGTGVSHAPSISPDGRFVAFTSEAQNLAPGLPVNRTQVYVRDLQAETTTLVSRASGPAGAVGQGFSSDPSISADGRFVAFRSTTNFVPEDRFNEDIYVRDLATQTTALASRASGPDGAIGNDISFHPSIAGNGTRVAFTSYATNFDPDHDEPFGAVFVRDLTTNETTLESRRSGASGKAGDSEAGGAQISDGGGRVAFISGSTNLVPGRDHPRSDIFVREIETDKTRLVSRDLPVSRRLKPHGAGPPSISANGERVAFQFGFTGDHRPGERQRVFIANLRRDEVQRVRGIAAQRRKAADEVGVSLSPDGRWIVVQSTARLHPDDRDSWPDIFLAHVPK